MSFDGDDDWALFDDGWNLILAGGNHVVDAFADDLEAPPVRQAGLQGHLDVPGPAPPHLGRYDGAFAEVRRLVPPLLRGL
jgi:hypothetical protein